MPLPGQRAEPREQGYEEKGRWDMGTQPAEEQEAPPAWVTLETCGDKWAG